MLELWNLMDTPAEEQRRFQGVACNIAASEDEITEPGALSMAFIRNVRTCVPSVLCSAWGRGKLGAPLPWDLTGAPPTGASSSMRAGGGGGDEAGEPQGVPDERTRREEARGAQGDPPPRASARGRHYRHGVRRHGQRYDMVLLVE
jgi:hypothetical protein